jgi:hypothetical protein
MKRAFDRETLLRLAREDVPTGEQVSRMGARLSASISAGVPASGLSWGAKALLTMVVAVPIAAVALPSPSQDEPGLMSTPVVISPRHPPNADPPVPEADEPAFEAVVPSSKRSEAPASSDRSTRATPSIKPKITRPAASEADGDAAASLAAEAKLLREAAAALRDHDARRSERLLLEHERRFPTGALSHERRVLHVKLLCLQGAIHRAADEAKKMIERGIPARAAAQLRGSCARVALTRDDSAPSTAQPAGSVEGGPLMQVH